MQTNFLDQLAEFEQNYKHRITRGITPECSQPKSLIDLMFNCVMLRFFELAKKAVIYERYKGIEFSGRVSKCTHCLKGGESQNLATTKSNTDSHKLEEAKLHNV